MCKRSPATLFIRMVSFGSRKLSLTLQSLYEVPYVLMFKKPGLSELYFFKSVTGGLKNENTSLSHDVDSALCFKDHFTIHFNTTLLLFSVLFSTHWHRLTHSATFCLLKGCGILWMKHCVRNNTIFLDTRVSGTQLGTVDANKQGCDWLTWLFSFTIYLLSKYRLNSS